MHVQISNGDHGEADQGLTAVKVMVAAKRFQRGLPSSATQPEVHQRQTTTTASAVEEDNGKGSMVFGVVKAAAAFQGKKGSMVDKKVPDIKIDDDSPKLAGNLFRNHPEVHLDLRANLGK